MEVIVMSVVGSVAYTLCGVGVNRLMKNHQRITDYPTLLSIIWPVILILICFGVE